jgi:hypothetical protein
MTRRIRLGLTVCIAIVLGGLFPAAAQASSTTVSGAADVGTSIYSTVRYNSYVYNAVYISNFQMDHGAGGCVALYLRDRATNREIAGTGCIPGTGNVYFKMFGTGSYYIPRGSFTLDLQITGSCGGPPGCGTMHWSGVLHYNVQRALTA